MLVTGDIIDRTYRSKHSKNKVWNIESIKEHQHPIPKQKNKEDFKTTELIGIRNKYFVNLCLLIKVTYLSIVIYNTHFLLSYLTWARKVWLCKKVKIVHLLGSNTRDSLWLVIHIILVLPWHHKSCLQTWTSWYFNIENNLLNIHTNITWLFIKQIVCLLLVLRPRLDHALPTYAIQYI